MTNQTIEEEMRALLLDLKATNLVKITGSYADGTQSINSDIDFYVKEDKPNQPFKERNLLKIIEVLAIHGINWVSTGVGYISTIKANNPMLPIELEFADHFNRRPNKLPTVTISGVEFRTH